MKRKNVPFEFAKAANQPELGFTRFEGYASTWNRDSGGDTIMPGAFTETLKERMPQKLIKVRWMHWEPMGVMVDGHEDTKGLYVVGKAPNTVTNNERFQLMEAGVVDRLSIGYDYDPKDVQWMENYDRILNKVILYEWSPVDLPMNEETDVTLMKSLFGKLGIPLPDLAELIAQEIQSKAATTYSNLSLGDRNHAWDAGAARKRIQSWAGADDAPNAQYRKGFFWYDESASDNFGSYKLPFADVIDGKLVAIPKGIFASAAALQGSRGTGVDIPEGDISGVKSHIEKYYAKMADEFDDDTIVAPWNNTDSKDQESKSNNNLDTKVGRVLSAKNRTLVEQARDALNELLNADSSDSNSDSSDKDDKTNSLEIWKSANFDDVLADIMSTIRR